MWGTGRYNVAQGFVGTAQGIGASTIGLVAGLIVDRFGYSAAFLTAAAVACASAATMYFTMPGTSPCRVLHHAGYFTMPGTSPCRVLHHAGYFGMPETAPNLGGSDRNADPPEA